MEVRIKRTNKTAELHSYNNDSGVDSVSDVIGNAGAFDDGQFVLAEDGETYIADQETYDWWNRELSLLGEACKAIDAIDRTRVKEIAAASDWDDTRDWLYSWLDWEWGCDEIADKLRHAGYVLVYGDAKPGDFEGTVGASIFNDDEKVVQIAEDITAEDVRLYGGECAWARLANGQIDVPGTIEERAKEI